MFFKALLLITGIVTALSFVDAPYPEELRLQHAPTPLALLALFWLSKRKLLDAYSLGCLLLFLWLHILGARWLYSMVPYDRWCQTLLGFELSEVFGWQRNHYDRLVHFSSGLLFLPALIYWGRSMAKMSVMLACVNGFAWVLAIGAVYEIFEWQLAVQLSPHAAESYNGQQGDVWDPQKDLALAAAGSVCGALLGSQLQTRLLLQSNLKLQTM